MSNSRFKAWFSDKIFQNLLQLASQVILLAMASMHEFLGLQMITRRGEWWSSPWRVAQKFEKSFLFHEINRVHHGEPYLI